LTIASLPHQRAYLPASELRTRRSLSLANFLFKFFAAASSNSVEYLRIVDTASPHSGDLTLSLPSSQPLATEERPVVLSEIPAELFEELWISSQAEAEELTRSEFSAKLAALGSKHNHGLPGGVVPRAVDVALFFRALHLPDLALAHGCALGRELAWQRFFTLYRTALTQAAIAITGSATLGHDLADSLHSELFGLTERDGQRRSPLESYSGRGALMGWLRTTLAQRHVDHYRRTRRDTPLEAEDPAAPPTVATPSPDTMQKLQLAIADSFQALSPEGRFLLCSYFLDGRTLHQIAQLLRVHEATVSRKLSRLTGDLRKRLLKSLQVGGLSRRGAEEALGTDPRDLTINLRSLLQTTSPRPFFDQAGSLDLTP
jgi:RNA polymerase sigma-70 factor, ECF subfamily